MDSPKITYRYYSNPAFCAQSEVVFSQQTPCVSPRILPASPDRPRMSPLGANSPRKQIYEIRPNRVKTDISDNPLRIVNGPLRYVKDEPPELPPKPAKFSHSRNGSINTLQRQRIIRTSKRSLNSSVRSRTRSEDLEMSSMSIKEIQHNDDDSRITNHRYEIIKDLDDIDYSPTKKRIIESETDEYNVDGPDENEVKAVPAQIVKTVNGKIHRYAIVASDDEDTPKRHNVTFSSSPMPKQQLIATQKLHELLSTPRKQTLKSYASQPSVRMISPDSRYQKEAQIYPVVRPKPNTSTPNRGISASKSCANLLNPKFVSPVSPRAQQKLNYDHVEREYERTSRQRSPDFTRNTRQRSFDRTLERRERNRSLDLDRSRSPDWERRLANRSFEVENYGREIGRSRFFDRERSPKKMDRTTAVISPRLAVQRAPSEFSEDTSYKTWESTKPGNPRAPLAIAALMLTLCGALTAGLSFYMMYAVGRLYYLDFSVLSGFTCLLLGLLGFRTRSYQLLPNRNYISGYLLLSTFALISCSGLLVLLIAQPPPGTALNDVTSGAVCALSVLSLCVASWGVIASYCCASPPPDNRVGHV